MFLGACFHQQFQLVSLDLINLVLLLLRSSLLASNFRVLKLMVLELGRSLDHLHGQDQVLVLPVIDDHVARAFAVVDKAALDKGDLDRRLVDVVLAELGEVQIVWICLLLGFQLATFHNATAVR